MSSDEDKPLDKDGLLDAFADGNTGEVQRLLEGKEIDVNSIRDDDGWTPLHWACS